MALRLWRAWESGRAFPRGPKATRKRVWRGGSESSRPGTASSVPYCHGHFSVRVGTPDRGGPDPEVLVPAGLTSHLLSHLHNPLIERVACGVRWCGFGQGQESRKGTSFGSGGPAGKGPPVFRPASLRVAQRN